MPLQHHVAHVSAGALHYVTAGSGPPVVLLHGWPQTAYAWRKLIPHLTDRFTVIAPDLRGLGDSARPLDGYDKRTVAGDVEMISATLGIARFDLVGHDWGGPTAFALASRHPDAVRSLTILDVTIPGIGPDISQGGKRWHHAFHMTPDLPEALVTGRERAYLSWFYRAFSWQHLAITEDDITEYVRTYSQPDALRAGFAYYRSIPRDIIDNETLLESGFRLKMPVLALGGARTEARGRANEPAESLRCIADDVTGGVIADSGHFIPEEQPEALAARLRDFLARRPA